MDMDKIFDHSYISQQAQQEHHKEQVKQVVDSAKKLKDFLDSTDSIEPQYQKERRVDVFGYEYIIQEKNERYKY